MFSRSRYWSRLQMIEMAPRELKHSKGLFLVWMVSIALGQLLESCGVCEPTFGCSSCSIFLMLGGSCLLFCVNGVKWPQPIKRPYPESDSCHTSLHSLLWPGALLPFSWFLRVCCAISSLLLSGKVTKLKPVHSYQLWATHQQIIIVTWLKM